MLSNVEIAKPFVQATLKILDTMAGISATAGKPYIKKDHVATGDVSAIVGVSSQAMLGAEPVLASALAVSTAIALMHMTQTLHPPGGATALIAVIGGPGIHGMGYWYVLLPCAAGAVCMLLLALVANNLAAGKKYPTFWW